MCWKTKQNKLLSSQRLPARTSSSQRRDASCLRRPSSRGWVMDESRRDTERIRLGTGPLLWANGANLQRAADTTSVFHAKRTRLQLWDRTLSFFLFLFFPPDCYLLLLSQTLWSLVINIQMVQVVQVVMWLSKSNLTLQPQGCFVLWPDLTWPFRYLFIILKKELTALLCMQYFCINLLIHSLIIHSVVFRLIKCTLSLVFATSLDLCRFISQSPLMWNCTPQIPAMEFLSSSSPLPSDFLPFIQPPLFFSSFFLISPPLGFFRSGVECFFFSLPLLGFDIIRSKWNADKRIPHLI